MIIAEDTIAEFAAEPGRPYVFSASGDFGGGSISLQWNDQEEWTTFPACELTEDGTQVITTPTNRVRFVVSGTAAPNFSANIVPTDTGRDSLTKDDLGLGEVDNTSDVDKPVSAAQREALDAKLSVETPFTGGYIGAFSWAGNRGLTIATSPDGYSWGGYLSQYNPPSGVLANPSIFKYNGHWWLVYFNGADQGAVTTHFGVAKSEDLANWTYVTDVDCSSISGIQYLWAPEAFIDEDGSLKVYFSAGPGSGISMQTYYVTPVDTTGLTTWNSPAQLSGLPSNHIDPFMVYKDGTYYLWLRNVTSGFIEIYSGSSETGTFSAYKTGDWAGWGGGMEAPSIIRRPDGSWLGYFDRFGNVEGYVVSAGSSDWSTWTPIVPVNSSIILRHGTVIHPEEIRDILNAWSNSTSYNYQGATLLGGADPLDGGGTILGLNPTLVIGPNRRNSGPASPLFVTTGGTGLWYTSNQSFLITGGLTSATDIFGGASGGDVTVYNGNLVVAKIGKGIQFSGGNLIKSGIGTPEGAVTASIGSMFLRTDGGAGTCLYVKESGSGNTGWVAK